jgi:hypothetical protein
LVIGFLLSHKRVFQILWVLLALICIGIVFLFRVELIPLEWARGRIQLVLLGAPFFLFVAIHLILMYQAWIHEKNRTILRSVRLIFFCILTGVFVLILLGFFIYFVV